MILPDSILDKPEEGLQFYNYDSGTIQSNIWKELRAGLWREFSIEAYISNDILNSSEIEKSKPLFKKFQQIIPGTKWNIKNKQLEKDLYIPRRHNGSFSDFLDICENYISSLNASKIGVHLSGGLDSSLIISVLHTLKIPFVPIGLKANTFEFRTERIVQDKLLEMGEDGLLIDIEDYPYYSNLLNLPVHQIPDADIKSVASSNALAEEFKRRGCDLVFNGLGGDTIFVDGIKDLSSCRINIGNEFLNLSEADRIYSPRGIRLESFFAHKEIIDFICSAREGEKVDNRKLWARNWAKEILPRELVEKTFYADFFGHTIWGLEMAKPDIRLLMEETYDITHHPFFNPSNIANILKMNFFSFEFDSYIHICSMISISSWFHSLFNYEESSNIIS